MLVDLHLHKNKRFEESKQCLDFEMCNAERWETLTISNSIILNLLPGMGYERTVEIWKRKRQLVSTVKASNALL